MKSLLKILGMSKSRPVEMITVKPSASLSSKDKIRNIIDKLTSKSKKIESEFKKIEGSTKKMDEDLKKLLEKQKGSSEFEDLIKLDDDIEYKKSGGLIKGKPKLAKKGWK